MLFLLQILKHVDKHQHRALFACCREIESREMDADCLADDLFSFYDIELSQLQIDMLERVCLNGSYKSAFALSA